MNDKKEEVVGKCSVKKVFLKTSQNSQENTFFGVSFLMKGLQKIMFYVSFYDINCIKIQTISLVLNLF